MWTVDPLDLNAVMAFAAVAEAQSFRGAARDLGLAKSTLSQRVAQLEERLGVQLFTRTTRRVRLTDFGESYYQAVAPALAAIRAAEALMDDLQERPRGRLRVTAPVELGQCVMGDALNWFSERYPEVEVWVELTDRVVDIIGEGFDLAIRVGPLEDSDLKARRLSTPQAKRLYASPDYIARCGAPERPEDLSTHACLVMTDHSDGAAWRLSGPDGPRSVAVRPQVAVNSWQVLRDLALAGRGVVRLPEMNARPAVAAGRLVEVLADYAPPPVACYALYPQARHLSPAVRAMIEVLIERLSQPSCQFSETLQPPPDKQPRQSPGVASEARLSPPLG